MELHLVEDTQVPCRPEKSKRRQRGKIQAKLSGGLWGPALMWSFLLALIVGILGFEFTNFVLPAGEAISSGADLLAGEIFRQSFFVDAQRGFRDSPYVYLMIVLSWGLGSLVVMATRRRRFDS